MKVLFALVIVAVSSRGQEMAQQSPVLAQQEAQHTAGPAHEMAEPAKRGPRLVEHGTGLPQERQGLAQQGPGVAQHSAGLAQERQGLAQQGPGQPQRLVQQGPGYVSGLYPALNSSSPSLWHPLLMARPPYQPQRPGFLPTERPAAADNAYYLRPVNLEAFQPIMSAAYQQNPQPMQVVNLVEYEPEDGEAQFLPFQEVLRSERVVQQAPGEAQRYLQRRAPSEYLTTLVYYGPQAFARTP